MCSKRSSSLRQMPNREACTLRNVPKNREYRPIYAWCQASEAAKQGSRAEFRGNARPDSAGEWHGDPTPCSMAADPGEAPCSSPGLGRGKHRQPRAAAGEARSSALRPRK
jgi:hypothetical protein